MFIKCESGYDRSGQQFARGQFLLLFSRLSDKKLFACVRKVSMTQFGHFMMGFARIGSEKITVSGTYGSDGLTLDLNKYEHLQKYLVEMPSEFFEMWSKGGGHNSGGSESKVFRKWAVEHIKQLQPKH